MKPQTAKASGEYSEHSVSQPAQDRANGEEYLEQEEVIPEEPKHSDKKFIEELSGENIVGLNLLVLGGNGTEIKFSDIYEYRHFLGKGGFGYVVHATHRETGKPVALKVSSIEVQTSRFPLDCGHAARVGRQVRA